MNNAQSCGYRPPVVQSSSSASQSAPRLKGKARKEAKAAAASQVAEPDYILPTREIVAQAEAIAKVGTLLPSFVTLGVDAVM